MINPQLREYIKKQVAQGGKKEELIGALKQRGWVEADIREAFTDIEKSIPNRPFTPQASPIQKPVTPNAQPVQNIPQNIPTIKSPVSTATPSVQTIEPPLVLKPASAVGVNLSTPHIQNTPVQKPPPPIAAAVIPQVQKSIPILNNQLSSLPRPAPRVDPRPFQSTPPRTVATSSYQPISTSRPSTSFPQSTPPVSPNPIVMTRTMPLQPVATSRGKVKKFFLTILILCILGALTYVGYLYYPSIYSLLFKKSEEEVFEKMLENMLTIKSFEYEVQVKANIEGGDILSSLKTEDSSFTSTEKYSIEVLGNGSYDFSDLGNQKFAQTLSLLGTTADPVTQYSLDIDTKMARKILYAKINQFTFPDLKVDLNTIINKWIEADLNEDDSDANSNLLTGGGTLTQTQEKDIEEAVKISSILKITEILGEEKIGNIDTYHYRLEWDKESIKALVYRLGKILRYNPGPERLANFERELATGELTSPEVWIGKEDFLPHKITFDGKIRPDGSSIRGDYALALFLGNFDKLTIIDIPNETLPFEEALRLLEASKKK